MYFLTYGLRKTWLEKLLKSPVSEDPWRSNMVKGTKVYSNLNDSTFTAFINLCDGNLRGKRFCQRYAKS